MSLNVNQAKSRAWPKWWPSRVSGSKNKLPAVVLTGAAAMAAANGSDSKKSKSPESGVRGSTDAY